MKRWTVYLTILATLAILALPAVAGKPSSATISLVQLETADATRTAGPSFGEHVTFDVSQSGWVRNRCWQSERLVLEEIHGFYDGALGDGIFTLGPTSKWLGGDADCTAELYLNGKGKDKVLASTSYSVFG